MKNSWFITGILLCVCVIGLSAQEIRKISLATGKGLCVRSVISDEKQTYRLSPERPLFTFELDDSLMRSNGFHGSRRGKKVTFACGNGLQGELLVKRQSGQRWEGVVTLTNCTDDEVAISNLVPLGQDEDHLYITASGPWSLARTKIFRPDRGPVSIIVPDNAWELGYSDIPLGDGLSVCALSRRLDVGKGQKHRWKTELKPEGSVTYGIYIELYRGPWQNGLKRMFQERWLYDLATFDNALFERQDLKWIRHAYVLGLQFAWDHAFYDAGHNGYAVEAYLDMGKKAFGGWDGIGLWPTWPTLGVDQRNQWDLYADMPGGLEKLRALAAEMQAQGTRFFIAYNPWDQSTRYVDHYEGMADLIRDTGADGVVLDCSGSSSKKLQGAADGVRRGVVMYSEGMAVARDMPGIVAGRVHDAIYLPPPVNLNKLIKPDFAIFRVCQLCQGRLHREFAISFFNGYGIEMNVFGPGRPDWTQGEYLYLGELVRILRENTHAFLSRAWTPLIPSRTDSVWVNRWPAENKTLYTVFSLRPAGYLGPLFRAAVCQDSHYVSLYHHEEVEPDTIDGTFYMPVQVNAFDRAWLGTRMEGNVDCLARFPRLLTASLCGDSLFVASKAGESIRIWAGNPSYQSDPRTLSAGSSHALKLMEIFGRYEGKFVVQLFEEGDLLDECVLTLKPGTPRLISTVTPAVKESVAPGWMVSVKGGHYTFQVEKKGSFIPYPDFASPRNVTMRDFYMDVTPVTNMQYKQFMEATGYEPADPVNFLKHWTDGKIPEDLGDHPVVYVSLEDARAYAEWAGKRLPTEMEWQYAAQGHDGRKWPWGAEYDSTRCNHHTGMTSPVDGFPEGKSPFGVQDLVGNVWQLTNDVYDNGSHYFIIMRGGSYYHPTSSWWYVKGGPQPLNQSQMLLRVSPGFERNATVGFRCVKDNEQ